MRELLAIQRIREKRHGTRLRLRECRDTLYFHIRVAVELAAKTNRELPERNGHDGNERDALNRKSPPAVSELAALERLQELRHSPEQQLPWAHATVTRSKSLA